MSSAAERRIWIGRAKAASCLLMVALVVMAALHFAPRIQGGSDLLTKAGERLPIESILIETDGNLDRDFVLRCMEIPEEANLLSVDLDAMKERLELIGQVASAVVSRRFPDALEVRIVERKPIARILAQRPNGDKLILFVDAKGEVFELDRANLKEARSLPFLDGVALSKQDERFSRIDDIEPLAELLSEAQAIAPHLYSYWRVVSLERSDRLIAKGPVAKEVLFDRFGDFRMQLGRLDYILDYYRSSRAGRIGTVDLTLGDQVPVRSL